MSMTPVEQRRQRAPDAGYLSARSHTHTPYCPRRR